MTASPRAKRRFGALDDQTDDDEHWHQTCAQNSCAVRQLDAHHRERRVIRTLVLEDDVVWLYQRSSAVRPHRCAAAGQGPVLIAGLSRDRALYRDGDAVSSAPNLSFARGDAVIDIAAQDANRAIYYLGTLHRRLRTCKASAASPATHSLPSASSCFCTALLLLLPPHTALSAERACCIASTSAPKQYTAQTFDIRHSMLRVTAPTAID